MALLHSLAVVGVFWLFLFVIDNLLRRYRPWKSSYLQRLEDWGVTLSFAHVRWYTTRFNKLFLLVGTTSKRACRCWFGLGALIGVLLMVLSVLVLCLTLYQAFTAPEGTQQVLTPVMPGVNLPWNDIAYYLLTLAVCGVFHEAGHALAASTEQVRVNGFGVFMLFLYPGAFVDLNSDHLNVISPQRQLRIYCAGVWHNVILVLCALGFLWTLPYSLAPFYSTDGGGVVVTSLPTGSVLEGKIHAGEVITSVNSCPVGNDVDWFKCLEEVHLSGQRGYCVSGELMSERMSLALNRTTLSEDGSRECCPKDTQSDICFQVVFGGQRGSVYKCLRARTITARMPCTHARDCGGVSEHACVFPTLSSPSKLLRISHDGGEDVLFLGDPRALNFVISISSYLPRSPRVPLWVPGFLRTLSTYFISLSSALALLNMVPAYFLDGQWTLTVLVDLCFEKRIPDPQSRNWICNCVLVAGSVLLGLNLCLAIWTLINWWQAHWHECIEKYISWLCIFNRPIKTCTYNYYWHSISCWRSPLTGVWTRMYPPCINEYPLNYSIDRVCLWSLYEVSFFPESFLVDLREVLVDFDEVWEELVMEPRQSDWLTQALTKSKHIEYNLWIRNQVERYVYT